MRMRAGPGLPGDDNFDLCAPPLQASDVVADHFRKITAWLILASCAVAVLMGIVWPVQLDFRGMSGIGLMIASLLLVSRIWLAKAGNPKIADAMGVIATTAIGGMACGAIAMLELRLHYPVADAMLQSWDHRLGVDGLAIVGWLLRQGHWIFAIMAPAYNYTIQVFFGGLIALSLMGDRVEAWRGALCFVGTLLTTCIIAAFFPAKGIGMFADPDLLAQLPPNAMRNFWPHFDEFYYGANPALRLQVIDGVISFPSFHTIVGLLIFAMWRKRLLTGAIAGAFLVVMLLAIFPGGGHYFVDMVGGFVVWAAWFALTRRVEQSLSLDPWSLESPPNHLNTAASNA